MSERSSHEHLKQPHTPETSGSHEQLKPHHTPEHHQTKHEHKENIDDIQRSIERHAKNAHETKHKHSPESPHEASEAFVTKELKILAFNRTMSRVRRNLSPIDRAFSKLVHNKAVDNGSAMLEKTVARPSALLGGGLIAALGGFAYFYIAKHYGYEYNATVLLILFLSGYLLGLLIEAIRKASRAN